MTYQRRTVGIVAAIVLALLGTMGLVGYVQGAKDDAVAGEKLVKVYVASDAIPAGTSVNSLEDQITTEKVPAKVKAQDAVTNLDAVKGKVTTVNIVAGEQLVKSRFASSVSTSTAKGVPAGMFGATVALDPERALGGQVRAGDHVAIVGVTAANGASETGTATMLVSNVLITSVQIDGENGDDPNKKEVTSAPTGKFMVTFALTPGDLEKVVNSANGGGIWLAADPAGAAQ